MFSRYVMACYNCARSYSLFNREHACGICGFGFCANCLQKKWQIKAEGGKLKEVKICSACYKTVQEP